MRKNEEIKGKIVTFKTFRELLLEEMNKDFPEEYESYMKIRQSDPNSASMQLDPAESIKKEQPNNQ